MQNQKPRFSILKTARASRARLGVLRTAHGTVRTPAYVIVATHANIRTLKPSDISRTKTQLVIANTYHLWDRAPKRRAGDFVAKQLKRRMPTMTDSGGFQVFSLGAAKEQGVGKVLKRGTHHPQATDLSVRITERGVHFTAHGRRRFLSPEDSIALQERLGADIIFAFDECTSPLHPLPYTKRSMDRTHRWAQRCLDARTRTDQGLMGIVQGGRFKSLRQASAKTLGALPFDGFGIGGSFGKDEMQRTLSWVVPHLPDEKPRHLLGIGSVQDIFDAVEAGIDTMDCVIPTREARHARLYTADGVIDIRKAVFANDRRKIDRSCACPVCRPSARVSRARLHALFRTRDERAGRFATLHNVWFFNTLLERIRTTLADGSYQGFKRAFLTRFSSHSSRVPSVAARTHTRTGSRGSRAYSQSGRR